MPFELRELEVDEIGFVDKGAGRGVRVTLFKARKRPEDSTVDKRVDTYLAALTKAKAKPETFAKFETLAKQGITLDDIKAKLTVQEWDILMDAMATAAAPPTEEGPVTATEGEDMPPAEPVEAQDGEDDEEMTKHRDELKKTREDLEKAQEKIAALEQANRLEKYRKEASELTYAYGSVEDIAKQLQACDDLGGDIGKSLRDSIVKAHEDRKASAHLRSFGSSKPSVESDTETAYAQLMAKAREIQETVSKAQGKRLSKEQAFARACRENRELWKAYAAERREGVRA